MENNNPLIKSKILKIFRQNKIRYRVLGSERLSAVNLNHVIRHTSDMFTIIRTVYKGEVGWTIEYIDVYLKDGACAGRIETATKKKLQEIINGEDFFYDKY